MAGEPPGAEGEAVGGGGGGAGGLLGLVKAKGLTGDPPLSAAGGGGGGGGAAAGGGGGLLGMLKAQGLSSGGSAAKAKKKKGRYEWPPTDGRPLTTKDKQVVSSERASELLHACLPACVLVLVLGGQRCDVASSLA